jgi:hypothetical protein
MLAPPGGKHPLASSQTYLVKNICERHLLDEQSRNRVRISSPSAFSPSVWPGLWRTYLQRDKKAGMLV